MRFAELTARLGVTARAIARKRVGDFIRPIRRFGIVQVVDKEAYTGPLIAEIARIAGEAIGLMDARSVRVLGLLAGVSPVETAQWVLGGAPR